MWEGPKLRTEAAESGGKPVVAMGSRRVNSLVKYYITFICKLMPSRNHSLFIYRGLVDMLPCANASPGHQPSQSDSSATVIFLDGGQQCAALEYENKRTR